MVDKESHEVAIYGRLKLTDFWTFCTKWEFIPLKPYWLQIQNEHPVTMNAEVGNLNANQNDRDSLEKNGQSNNGSKKKV